MPPVVMWEGQAACNRIGIGELEQTRHLLDSHTTCDRNMSVLLLYDSSQQGLNQLDVL
jgi:hypothetical protein